MTENKLSKIKAPVNDELKQFNALFKESMKSSVTLVDLVTGYILKQKGKKIRPLLVLLSAKLCGGVTERSYRGAILVELLHTATLVHDDVVDNAEKRRGFPSINAIWKNKISVLLGDYLLAKGLMLSVEGTDFDFLGIVTGTVKRMSEGELLQISKTRKLNLDEDTYFRIISDKTASLLSTCCEIGAGSATEDEEKQKRMRDFGEYLGIAFQIRDDILDLVGKTKVFGKNQGGDIKEKKVTLPLLYALKNSPEKEAEEIKKMIKKGADSEAVKKIINFTVRYNGINYAEEVALSYAEKARAALDIFENSPEKESLTHLVQYVIDRNK
ncbi:MAG: polyprenyl synthetase [Melioribacteraceae bacterium]|nr:MAG: polyprenyl synthetase [Melioribacteraceae bacterium]